MWKHRLRSVRCQHYKPAAEHLHGKQHLSVVFCIDLYSHIPPAPAASVGGEYALSPRPDELPVPPRQTLFFSATWPKEVQAIARKLCRNDPVQVFVGNVQVRTVHAVYAGFRVLLCAGLLGCHGSFSACWQDVVAADPLPLCPLAHIVPASCTARCDHCSHVLHD